MTYAFIPYISVYVTVTEAQNNTPHRNPKKCVNMNTTIFWTSKPRIKNASHDNLFGDRQFSRLHLCEHGSGRTISRNILQNMFICIVVGMGIYYNVMCLPCAISNSPSLQTCYVSRWEPPAFGTHLPFSRACCKISSLSFHLQFYFTFLILNYSRLFVNNRINETFRIANLFR